MTPGDNDEEDPAMADAFRQLESLDSSALGEMGGKGGGSVSSNIKAIESEDFIVRAALEDPPSLESEAKVYSDYLQEMEAKCEDDLYRAMLADIMEEGTTKPLPTTLRPPADVASKTSITSPSSGTDNEALWNQALEEAMDEVKLNNPKISESIMDDEGFKKEIEAIFDRGNEKLLASLEEIRKEQVSYIVSLMSVFLPVLAPNCRA
jgi:hypothetical protein